MGAMLIDQRGSQKPKEPYANFGIGSGVSTHAREKETRDD